MKIARAIFPLLTVAAGAAFAQDPPLTGIIKAGALEIIRTNSKFSAGPPIGTLEITQDNFAASFSSIDLSKLVKGGETAPVTTIGTCFIVPLGLQLEQGPRTDAVTYLDAGPVINLTGPAGKKEIPLLRTGPGMTVIGYGAALGGGLAFPNIPPPPPLFVEPGTYTADNGGGGADVGSFTATLEVPSLFAWTNADTISIDRAAGADFTWTGGDPNGKVYIAGSVAVTNTATRRVEGGATFTCIAENSAGHFVVPPEVLTLLPASTTTAAGVSNGNLIVSHGVEAKFDAPGVGETLFMFISGITRNADFK